jgi:hypothetical protein
MDGQKHDELNTRQPTLVEILSGRSGKDTSFALTVTTNVSMKPLYGKDSKDGLNSTCLAEAHLACSAFHATITALGIC